MEKFIKVLLYFWQLPQNLLGAIILCFYKCDMWFTLRSLTPEVYDAYNFRYKNKSKKNSLKKLKKNKWCNPDIFICPYFKGGISLGGVIILKQMDIINIHHEYAHSLQSLYLGWLYLPVIGLPWFLHAAFYKRDPNDPNKYYRFWTERLADKMAGIKR